MCHTCLFPRFYSCVVVFYCILTSLWSLSPIKKPHQKSFAIFPISLSWVLALPLYHTHHMIFFPTISTSCFKAPGVYVPFTFHVANILPQLDLAFPVFWFIFVVIYLARSLLQLSWSTFRICFFFVSTGPWHCLAPIHFQLLIFSFLYYMLYVYLRCIKSYARHHTRIAQMICTVPNRIQQSRSLFIGS